MEEQTDPEIHDIPEDILINILTKLPTKSLCRSKSLSKSYHSLIKSPIFIHKFRPRIPPQWTNLPPKQHLLPNNNEITELHIYEIQNNEVSTTVQTYKPPPGTFFLRQYKDLICSYSESSQLTIFNTVTQDSKTVYFPVTDEHIKDPYRNFEYGYDPLSKKFKVFTYRFENRLQLRNDYVETKANFEVFTLGEESTTWRLVKQEFNINLFSECVTVVGESLFWFDDFVELNEPISDDYDDYECEAIPPQIVSFNFTKEELVRIEIPGKVIDFEYYPLFDFEGCLCFVVEAMESTSSFQWELNLWMLQDIYSSRWMMMKRISLPLGGTNLRYFPIEDTVEFSTQNDELLIAVCDDINQYVFSYNFLSGECEKMKITGEPLCKNMKMILSLWHGNGTDYDSYDDD